LTIDKKPTLVTLVLSHDSGSFAKIQNEGQDLTFMLETPGNAIAFRYIGKSISLPMWFKLIFLVRKFQYSALHYSRFRPVGLLLKFLTGLRLFDKAIRTIPSYSQNNRIPTCIEVIEDGKNWKKLVTETPEDWALIGLKTILALKFLLENYEFDYLFRTNTTSYVDTSKLLEHLEHQPKSNLYSGVVGSAFGDLEFASGAGILLSRDVVQRICDNENKWKHGFIDDLALGEVVSNLKHPEVTLVPLPRIDLYTLKAAKEIDEIVIKNGMHFRCKSSSAEETIAIMKHIHEVKTRSQV
jgi:hypothetical protein